MGQHRKNCGNRNKIDVNKLYNDVQILKSLHPKEFEKREAERLEAERLEAERIEAERIEEERLEAERIEAERIELERIEAERLEAQRIELERLELERIEAERINNELRLEAERIEKERKEKEQSIIKHIDNEQKIIKELMNKIDNEEINKTPPIEDAKICGELIDYSDEEAEISEGSEDSDSLERDIEEELKKVEPKDTSKLEKKILELCGNIQIEDVICEDCEKIRDEYIKKCKEDGVELTTYNYHRSTCKPCQKARFNSWKAKKKMKKKLEKAEERNNENKSQIKTIDKKRDLKNKLSIIDEEYKQIREDKAIDKLEKIGKGESNGKVQLNIFINKNSNNTTVKK